MYIESKAVYQLPLCTDGINLLGGNIIRARMIRTDVGKISFVNRTIAEWNQLPEEAIGTPPLKRIHLGRGLGK
jgi:hypothetical protein